MKSLQISFYKVFESTWWSLEGGKGSADARAASGAVAIAAVRAVSAAVSAAVVRPRRVAARACSAKEREKISWGGG